MKVSNKKSDSPRERSEPLAAVRRDLCRQGIDPDSPSGRWLAALLNAAPRRPHLAERRPRRRRPPAGTRQDSAASSA